MTPVALGTITLLADGTDAWVGWFLLAIACGVLGTMLMLFSIERHLEKIEEAAGIKQPKSATKDSRFEALERKVADVEQAVTEILQFLRKQGGAK